MAKLDATITVKNAEGGGPLGNVEVELVGLEKGRTGPDGVAHFSVDEGVAYDLKVRHDALRPTYKDSGEFWLTDVVNKLPDDKRQRYRMLPGEAVVWGITFSQGASTYEVQMQRQLQHAGTVAATPGGKVVFDKAVLEVLIIAGTNRHDNTYGNKLMFLAQAVRAVRAIYSQELYLSVLVFPQGYTDEEISQARAGVLNGNGAAQFITLQNKSELVNYINTRTTDGSYDYRSNERLLLKEVRIFAHGRPNTFLFGMEVAEEANLDLPSTDLPSLKPEAWNPGAVLSSYACRTGNSSFAEHFDDDWRTVAKPETSMAQQLAELLGVKVRAFVTRSSYAATWGEQKSKDEKQKKDYHDAYRELADQGVSAGTINPFADAKSNFALWNPNGAWADPFSKPNSPSGLTDERGAVGVWVFEKGKAPRKE